jgi:hypothetical protein
MKNFDPIPLDVNPSNVPIKNGESVQLRHTFDLEPISEICLRFYLHIDSSPDGTIVHLNRWQVGPTQSDQPFIADVTDYVSLEDNLLLLDINTTGTLGNIWLERVPCEALY